MPGTELRSISPLELQRRGQGGVAMEVIDVRFPVDFAAAHVPIAMWWEAASSFFAFPSSASASLGEATGPRGRSRAPRRTGVAERGVGGRPSSRGRAADLAASRLSRRDAVGERSETYQAGTVAQPWNGSVAVA